MLVSVMMCSPRSRPDISEGDSVSPACAKITWPPLALALVALGLHDGGKPREAAAALPSGITWSPMM